VASVVRPRSARTPRASKNEPTVANPSTCSASPTPVMFIGSGMTAPIASNVWFLDCHCRRLYALARLWSSPPGVRSHTSTSRSGSGNGSGLSNTALSTAKTETVAAMPNVNVATETKVNDRSRASSRRANRMSCRMRSRIIIGPHMLRVTSSTSGTLPNDRRAAARASAGGSPASMRRCVSAAR
jgi:hypothetical protein